jgi:hypothetical protein
LAYNLFVAYDLLAHGQNYDAVCEKIKELGAHWQFQHSLFWVHTDLDPDEAYFHVSQAMEDSDRLAVINCASRLGAVISNWDSPLLERVSKIWVKP